MITSSEKLTAKEMLAQWDGGETIWTVEMGGLGPGYEQAIHIFCFDIIRELVDSPMPEDKEEIKKWLNDAADKVWKGKGYSGAQAGAAMGLAYKFLKFGSSILDTAPKDRLIMVDKNFPNADHPEN